MHDSVDGKFCSVGVPGKKTKKGVLSEPLRGGPE